MTRINLLPPERRERQRARRQTAVVAAVALLVILGLAFFYVLKQLDLSRVQDDLRAQEAVNAKLERDVNDLRQFDQLVAQIEAKRRLLAVVLQNEVQWSGVLRDVSLVIPADVWLSSLNGQITDPFAAGGVTDLAALNGLIGTISMDGFANRHPTVATWLTRLAQVRGFLNPWIASSTESDIGEIPVVQFQSSVDLGQAVTVQGRQRV